LIAYSDSRVRAFDLGDRDATPCDAFVLRQSAPEYVALQSSGLRTTVCYRQAPLSVVVLPFAEGKWGTQHEWTLPEE
jgi:hypothetical protein